MTAPDTEQPSVLSPYLTLREAVRPAIVVFSILAQEQNRAATLAKEADDLLQATRELLTALGAMRLQSVEAGESLPSMPELEVGQRAGLLDAYAEAGMMWARVVGSSLVVAEALLEQGKWDMAQRLADFLDAAGEPAAAGPLRVRAQDAARRATEKRLSQIHGEMPDDEIAAAIKALEDTGNARMVVDHLSELAHAVWRLAAPKTKKALTWEQIPKVMQALVYSERAPYEQEAWGQLHELATMFYKFQAEKERTLPRDG